MRPRFLGTRQYPRVVGGSGATQRYRAARSRARRTGRDIVRIDLSRIVSKYVGETERNLRVLFEDAQRSNAVLYFDEADALFETASDDERKRAAHARRSLLTGARKRKLALVLGRDATAKG